MSEDRKPDLHAIPGGKVLPMTGLRSRRFMAASLRGEPKPRVWLDRGNDKSAIPGDNVTMVGGDGAAGKSTLMLHASVAAATGFPWLGRHLRRGPVIYVSCEDDRDELHRRMDNIGLFYGVQLSDVPDLHLIDLSAEDGTLAAPDNSGVLVAVPQLVELEEMIEEVRPVLVVLDSLADVFGGDEINRSQARRFIGLLRAIAQRHTTAIVILAHPSLSGMASGSGSSGSTHWNNSVRSRLYLTKPDKDEGLPAQSEVRLLQSKKANYAASGWELRLRLQAGAFVLDDPGGISSLDQLAAENRVDDVFLHLLTAFTAEGRGVGHRPSSNYAPVQFSKDGRSQGIRKAAFEASMSRLFEAGKVRVEKAERGVNRLVRVEGA